MISLRYAFLPGFTLLLGCSLAGGGKPPVDAGGKPLIVKEGTLDCDCVETTPIVFNGEVWRCMWVRMDYAGRSTDPEWAERNYFQFVNEKTGETSAPFAPDHVFASAYQEGDWIYVTGTSQQEGWYGHKVTMFATRDLKNWETWTVIDDPRYGICNTSICRGDDGYVLMFEIHQPPEEAGVPFTARFARSKDLREWTITPAECTYGADRYAAPHCIRFIDGWYYNFYLEAHEGYEQRVVRSRDLVNWEASPLNPVLKASPEDKQILSPRLTEAESKRIAEAQDLNNSDVDFCEHDGRLVIYYSWGNQQGNEFHARAHYDGSLADFLRGWFPEDASR